MHCDSILCSALAAIKNQTQARTFGFTPHPTLRQVDEKTKTVCKPAGNAEALTADEAEVSGHAAFLCA